MTLPSEYDFLKDPALDADMKKSLLQALLEEKKFVRDAPIEQKRFWHSTPLMLALVGTITIAANGLVAYVQSSRITSDTVTLEQLKSQLKDSESRSAAARAGEASEAEAKRTASKEEREFAFKIIEKELGKTGDATSRASVLLFLARAGILNSLNRKELEDMAKADIRSAGKDPETVGIPPSFGRPPPRFGDLKDIPFDKVIVVASHDDAQSDRPLARLTVLTLSDCEEVIVSSSAESVAARVGAAVPLMQFKGGVTAKPFWVRPDLIKVEMAKPDNSEGKTLTGVPVVCANGGREIANMLIKESVLELRAMLKATPGRGPTP
jgi:hypothetical protein